MSDRKLEKLPNEVLGSAQLYQVISVLGAAIDSMPKTTTKTTSKSEPGKVVDLPDLIKPFFRSSPTPTEMAELKGQLEQIIQTAPVVRITLSDFPDPAFCNKLAAWFRSIHPYCLVEVLVDNSIIGGVIVRSGRRIFDYSIRTQLAQSENSLTGILTNA